MLTDDEILALTTAPESAALERKASAADRSSLRRTICAFSNDLADSGNFGAIVVGLTDEGDCAELKTDDELVRKLASMRDDGNILPVPSMQVFRYRVGECPIIVIVVHPSTDPPVRYQGRVWVRIGSTTRQATPEEEQRLIERRRSYQLPFDHRPAQDAKLTDLDLDVFRRTYLPAAVAAEVLERNERSVESQLASLRLFTSNVPNFGAILIFGVEPLRWVQGAYVHFLRIAGTELGDPVKDTKRLSGPLHDVVRMVDELLDLNIMVAVKISDGSRERRIPDYPVAALQQYVRNALIHRTYEGTNSPVRLYWFDDRVEIHSPGGLFGQVREENFGSGVTDYRNPLIAEAMAHLGYVQRFGFGVPLAERALRENGNPSPKYEFQPTAVAVTVTSRS